MFLEPIQNRSSFVTEIVILLHDGIAIWKGGGYGGV